MNPAARFIGSDDDDNEDEVSSVDSTQHIRLEGSRTTPLKAPAAQPTAVAHTVTTLLRDLSVFVASKHTEEASMRKYIAELERGGNKNTPHVKTLLGTPHDDMSNLQQDHRDLVTRYETQSKLWAAREAELRGGMQGAMASAASLASRLSDSEALAVELREKAEELGLMYKGRLREEDRLRDEAVARAEESASKERRLAADLRDTLTKLSTCELELEHERARGARGRVEASDIHQQLLAMKDELARAKSEASREIVTLRHEVTALTAGLASEAHAHEKVVVGMREREGAVNRSVALAEKQRVECEAELHFTIMKLKREVGQVREEMQEVRREKSRALGEELVERDRTIQRLERGREELATEVTQLTLTLCEYKDKSRPPFEDIESPSPTPSHPQPKLRQLIEANNDLRSELQSALTQVQLVREQLDQRSQQLALTERKEEAWRRKANEGAAAFDPMAFNELKLRCAAHETTEASLRAQLHEARVLYSTLKK